MILNSLTNVIFSIRFPQLKNPLQHLLCTKILHKNCMRVFGFISCIHIFESITCALRCDIHVHRNNRRWEAWVIGSEPKERLILCYCCTSEIDHYPTSVDELNACGDEVLHKRVFHFYPPNRLSEGRAMRSRAD
ncbi:hypothetical protein T4D_13399 [Trichinella pseudospiralis]|uniref:Uncharacterized protein n=1 Tax=Trichinella pseudospiralis TaxID=6337 RepID=A0A0V1FR31_TRIPS|nr:hypothetical protein T4D_13399 [Trichinella pseudospiralis]